MADMTKQSFLEQMRLERVKWLALLDEVAPAWRDEAGVCGIWSIRDLVAHVGIWESWGAKVARTVTEGRYAGRNSLFDVEIPADVATLEFDPFNEWLVEQHAGETYAQVVDYERDAYRRFVDAFTALDEADLGRGARDFPATALFDGDTLGELMAGQAHDHWREHAAQIRAWLAERGG
jgi:hypothetical protein